jgi:orotidine-5'-phosphate decarboxylase
MPEIIVALDYSKFSEIKSIVENLGNAINFYKVGLEAFISIGKEALEYLKVKNKKIFLDLKLHDIPNTVKKAALAASYYNVEILSLHIQGGVEMISDTQAHISSSLRIDNRPLLIGITALTSLDDKYINDFKINFNCIENYALHLANIGKHAGLNGVVCSVGEVKAVKKLCGNDFKVVCPGIRLDKTNVNDQKRVYTPLYAKQNGADYIVIGRAITENREPLKIVESITEELKI